MKATLFLIYIFTGASLLAAAPDDPVLSELFRQARQLSEEILSISKTDILETARELGQDSDTFFVRALLKGAHNWLVSERVRKQLERKLAAGDHKDYPALKGSVKLAEKHLVSLTGGLDHIKSMLADAPNKELLFCEGFAQLYKMQKDSSLTQNELMYDLPRELLLVAVLVFDGYVDIAYNRSALFTQATPGGVDAMNMLTGFRFTYDQLMRCGTLLGYSFSPVELVKGGAFGDVMLDAYNGFKRISTAVHMEAPERPRVNRFTMPTPTTKDPNAFWRSIVSSVQSMQFSVPCYQHDIDSAFWYWGPVAEKSQVPTCTDLCTLSRVLTAVSNSPVHRAALKKAFGSVECFIKGISYFGSESLEDGVLQSLVSWDEPIDIDPIVVEKTGLKYRGSQELPAAKEGSTEEKVLKFLDSKAHSTVDTP